MKRIELRKNNITNYGDIITDVAVLEPTEKGTTNATTGSLIEWGEEWNDHEIKLDIYDVANCFIAAGYKLYYVE